MSNLSCSKHYLKNSMNNKFCSFPFHNVTTSWNNNQITMRPCCWYQGKITNYQTVQEYFNSKEMQDLRDHFLSDPGELPTGCKICAYSESKGLKSFRQINKQHFSTVDITVPKVQFTQLNIGWACNMSCYMCHPKISSGVAEEYRDIGLISNIPKKNVKAFYKIIENIPEGTEVDFTNGEFFVDATSNRLLEIALERNLILTFSTNCSTVTNEQLDKLLKLKKVNISVSLDGIESLYYIMRYPFDWNNFKNNLDKLMTTGRVNQLRCVAQILNMFGLVDYFKFGNQIGIDTEIMLVQEKAWLRPEALEDSDRENLLKIMNNQIHNNANLLKQNQIEILTEYINYIENCKFNAYENMIMIKRLSAIWKHRKQDFSLYQDIYPAMYNKICDSININV